MVHFNPIGNNHFISEAVTQCLMGKMIEKKQSTFNQAC